MEWISNPTLLVAVVLGALLLLLLGAYALSSRRTQSTTKSAGVAAQADWIMGLKEGEEMASPAAEAIEALAQAKLSQYADLAGIQLDFGTAGSGGLEIWVGSDRYGAVDEIPDERIRVAIAAAVEEFNRTQSGHEAA